jgi:N-formylglutamate deformylase
VILRPTPPFPLLERPPGPLATPVVVSSPHSGRVIPADEVHLYEIAPERLAHDGDLYVDELYRDCPSQLGVPLLCTPYSRFLVDLNRLPDDLSPRSVAGSSYQIAPGYYRDRGVVWAVTTRGERIYRRPLTSGEFELRMQRYFRPYHEALGALLAEARAQFGFAILLDAHSMPSEARTLHTDRGATRSDIVPGDLFGKSCDPALTHAVCDFFRTEGFEVAPNTPYMGGGITRRFADPARGIHAIQLEINRRLYMNEDNLERLPELKHLRRIITRFVAQLTQLPLPSGST